MSSSSPLDPAKLLDLPADKALERLEHAGFRDPAGALANLRRLVVETPRTHPPPSLLAEAAASPDPDAALNQVERVASASISHAAFMSMLETRPEVCHHLVRLLSTSPFLTDILVRNPTFLHGLFDTPGLLSDPVSPDRLREGFLRGMAIFRSPERKLNALRRLVRRELLRLGAADLTGESDILGVARGLADLADAVLQTLIDLLLPPLVARYGIPRDGDGAEVGLAVIALGKLGGAELNFSSDIDLMFVYGSDGETRPEARGGRPVTNHEFFNALAGAIARHVAETTDEGFLYRVDLRLRPDGEAGAMARSIAGFERYYEDRGEVWERQMLIKARVCAGDRDVGAVFLRMVEPFVYPSHLEFSPPEEVRRIKDRIEVKLGRRGQRETHLKLRPGGIRDVEFVVQVLQLLLGGKRRDVRAVDTAGAVEALRRAGGLSEAEAKDLSQAYRFYRRLEHRLQMRQNRSAYVLPTDPETLRPVALSLGYPGPAQLRKELDAHLGRVRRIYDDLFRSTPPQEGLSPAAICEREPGDPEVADHLLSLGFRNPDDAHRNLVFLAYGHFPRLRGTRAARRFLDLAPRLLEAAGGRSDPDAALNRFERVVSAYGAPHTLYQVLIEGPGLLDLLLGLCAESGFLSELICRQPALLDWLTIPDVLLHDRSASEMEAEIDDLLPRNQEAGTLAALNAFKNRELLRIGTRDILGLAHTWATLGQLALLAETVIRRAHRMSEEILASSWGQPLGGTGRPAQYAVIGLGKLGGREMDFGSDLDLVFVYSDDGETSGGEKGRMENLPFFIDMAQETLNLLSHPTSHGLLYRVDARLRPEGGSAMLALSLDAYDRYLTHRAAAWERLALCRARIVAGDEEFGRRVIERIDAFVVGDGLGEGDLAEIAAMRRRMEEGGREKYPGRIHLKTGRGGIADVEFVAQTLQIAHARLSPGLRTPGTMEALGRLRERGLVAVADHDALTDAYLFLRTVEKAMRRADDHARNVLPEDPRALDVLARSVGFPDAGPFLDALGARMDRNRTIFERLVGPVQQ